MANRRMIPPWGALPLLAASLGWPGTAIPAKPASAASAPIALSDRPAPAPAAEARPAADPSAVAGSNAQVTQAPDPKPLLSDAFIAQNVLRVYLNHPASVSVYNSRGQQVFHLDTQRNAESIRLQGITTGFVYLVVRAGPVEMTKKLVYMGK